MKELLQLTKKSAKAAAGLYFEPLVLLSRLLKRIQNHTARLTVFSALFVTATLLRGAGLQDTHTKENFLPIGLEGWRITKNEPLLKEKRRLRRDKAVTGGEIRELKSNDRRKGALILINGIVVVKLGDVEKNHTHAAVMTDEGEWVFGEAGTLSFGQTSGNRFCLENYFTKKPACGAEVTLSPY